MQPPKTYSVNDSSDSLDSLVFTLDPKDKYRPPGVRRARTTSAIQQRKSFLPKTPRKPLITSKSDYPEAETREQTPSSTRDGPTLKPQRSLISIFDKLRRTKSAGSSNSRATTSWHRRLLSRAGSRAGLSSRSSRRTTPPEGIPAVPQIPPHILGAPKGNTANLTPPASDGPAAHKAVDYMMPLVHAIDNLAFSPGPNDRICIAPLEALSDQEVRSQNASPNTSLQGNFGAPSKSEYSATQMHKPEAKEDHHSEPGCYHQQPPGTDSKPEDAAPSLMFYAAVAALSNQLPKHRDSDVDGTFPVLLHGELEPTEHYDPTLGFNCADSSYATHDNFSPNLASKSTQSGPMSPIQLSQPETPAISDFGDDAVSWRCGSDSLDVELAYPKPPSRAAPLPPNQPLVFSNPFKIKTAQSGFQGYSIPQNDPGSAHTIRKSSNLTFGYPEHPLHHQAISQDLVHSWNDGSGHRMTALEELIDDVGYLGAFIE